MTDYYKNIKREKDYEQKLNLFYDKIEKIEEQYADIFKNDKLKNHISVFPGLNKMEFFPKVDSTIPKEIIDKCFSEYL